MDIIQKLNEVQKSLSDKQEEERKIVNSLMILMFGSEEKKLPKDFEVECLMDNQAIETFLREKLEVDVKKVSLIPMSFLFGCPRFQIELN